MLSNFKLNHSHLHIIKLNFIKYYLNNNNINKKFTSLKKKKEATEPLFKKMNKSL